MRYSRAKSLKSSISARRFEPRDPSCKIVSIVARSFHHYFERFHAHDVARKAAVGQLAELNEGQLQQLSEATSTPRGDLKFVLEAHRQVIDCRRILKWTYAYGYYKFDELALRPGEGASHAEVKDLEAKAATLRHRKTFFEFCQNDAESSLEPLTLLLENKLGLYFQPDHFWQDQAIDVSAVRGSRLCRAPSDRMRSMRVRVRSCRLCAQTTSARGLSAITFVGVCARAPARLVGRAVQVEDSAGYMQQRFAELQQDLVNRTQMAKTFFEKLVAQLEQGFDESPDV